MKRNVNYQPPFVYFGGKSAVASIVWDALGDPDNYVEPFAGSAAVLFLRPHEPKIETINDADGFVANFWRAMKHDSDAVAEYADNQVNECEMTASHLWLVNYRERLTERLMGDKDWFDAEAAGRWVYGLNCWIGSGWCSGKGPWVAENGQMVLGDSGQGVNRKLPHLRNSGQGSEPETPRREWLKEYLGWFANRLARVRVCCGDWSRVCGPSVTFKHGLTGVFLDPPYADSATRTAGLYAVDCEQVAHAAREWAIEQGKNPKMRIVLSGYDGEHEMPDDWQVIEWSGNGGYANEGDDDSLGKRNIKRERLWLSPFCRTPERARQRELLA